PERIVDYLSLIGDTVDNIPGLSGVGPKTAASWIETYGDIDGILAARESITPERFRVLLREADALLRLNRQLIAFRTDFTGEWDADGQEDEAAMRVFFERMEMHSSLKELARRNQPQPEKQTQLELLF
ncbi:MAG: hypothetical protein LBV28_01515, partial [Puniceicoccales bacterium]|nr:hypothetical protein [Puniceicoccales bacterium]